MENTKHNSSCKMAFGRPSKHNTCPRCEELKAGATARKGWGSDKKERERQLTLAIRNHDCKKSGCAYICVAFDW